MAAIVDNRPFKIPGTIEDQDVIEEIKQVL